MHPHRSLVVIPTYNEIDNIRLIVPAVLEQEAEFDLLIVDDGSPDGTGAAVVELQQQWGNRLHLLSRRGKLGLGTAYLDGFRWGLARDYEFLFEMDADFSHDPHDLVRLLLPALRNQADVVVGSRYTSGGHVENWPVDRKALSYGASLYVRLITWMPVKDPTAGFKCYRREVLEAMNLDSIRFIGYAFQIEMKFRAWQLGYRVAEVPITFTDRVVGQSKMSSSIVKEAVLGVLQMRFGKRPAPRQQSLPVLEQRPQAQSASAKTS